MYHNPEEIHKDLTNYRTQETGTLSPSYTRSLEESDQEYAGHNNENLAGHDAHHHQGSRLNPKRSGTCPYQGRVQMYHPGAPKSKPVNLRPPKFESKKTDVRHFFSRYDKFLSQYPGWNDNQKVNFLGNLIDDDALYFLDYLEDSTKVSYQETKKEFVEHYTDNKPLQKQWELITERKLGEDESLTEYYDALLKMSDDLGLGEEQRLFFFLNGLPQKTKNHITLTGNPNNTKEALKMAKIFKAVNEDDTAETPKVAALTMAEIFQSVNMEEKTEGDKGTIPQVAVAQNLEHKKWESWDRRFERTDRQIDKLASQLEKLLQKTSKEQQAGTSEPSKAEGSYHPTPNEWLKQNKERYANEGNERQTDRGNDNFRRAPYRAENFRCRQNDPAYSNFNRSRNYNQYEIPFRRNESRPGQRNQFNRNTGEIPGGRNPFNRNTVDRNNQVRFREGYVRVKQ